MKPPEETLQYPVTPKWRELVRAAIGPTWGAQAQLARRIGCSAATLNGLLLRGRRSHLVQEIHEQLGWPKVPDFADHVEWIAKHGELAAKVIRRLMSIDRAQLEVINMMLEQMCRK